MRRICARGARSPASSRSARRTGSACGDAGPARPEPGRSGPADVLGLERRARDGRDDRRQHADGRGGRRDDPRDRPAAGRATRPVCAPTSRARSGFEADRSEAVKTIDEKLLLVTCTVLILLLLAIYRSPLMALVPIFVVGIAYIVAGGLTYLFVRAGVTTVSGQSTAILIVLMFGAGTDYCLLLVARFRDELRRTADPGEAMERASEHTRPAILSAGAIVVAAMLVLARRRLQRHARDGADPRARHRGHGRGRADAAARAARRARPARVLAGRPARGGGAAAGPGAVVARRPARRPPPRAHRRRGHARSSSWARSAASAAASRSTSRRRSARRRSRSSARR